MERSAVFAQVQLVAEPVRRMLVECHLHHHTEQGVRPVLCVTPFDTEDEVVAPANGAPFGQPAGIWTSDGSDCRSLLSARMLLP
jgi:hypothetical protein